jgi:hypothetical protein
MTACNTHIRSGTHREFCLHWDLHVAVRLRVAGHVDQLLLDASNGISDGIVGAGTCSCTVQLD